MSGSLSSITQHANAFALCSLANYSFQCVSAKLQTCMHTGVSWNREIQRVMHDLNGIYLGIFCTSVSCTSPCQNSNTQPNTVNSNTDMPQCWQCSQAPVNSHSSSFVCLFLSKKHFDNYYCYSFCWFLKFFLLSFDQNGNWKSKRGRRVYGTDPYVQTPHPLF